MTKKKILFLTKTPTYGGTEQHLTDLIERLPRSQVQVVIACLHCDVYTHPLNQERGLGITILQGLTCKTWVQYWWLFLKIRPQVIVFVNGWLGLFPWYAYAAAKLSGARRIVAIEQLIAEPSLPQLSAKNNLMSRLRKVVGWRARYLFKMRLPGLLCNVTIAVSHAVRDQLVNGYGFPPHKTITIFNGVDLRQYHCTPNPTGKVRSQFGIGPNEEVLVCAASLVQQKRVDILLEALSRVIKRHHLCRCLILGDGPLRESLSRLTESLGLVSSVTFVGHVKDVRPFLEIASMFVLSSDKEGLPLALLEAMASGLPCIVTDAGGNREAVIHENTGLVVPPRSPNMMADAIVRLLGNKEERKRMGTNARTFVEEHFNKDVIMKKVEAMLLG